MGLLTKPNELTIKETYAGLIYGQPGTGKSTLALSSVNPVCIDVDRGMYRVEKRYQAPSLQVEDYRQVLDLLNSHELDGFDTIVIDTLGKLIDRMGEHLGAQNPKLRNGNGQLTQQGWGQLKVEFHALIQLINGSNKSVLFVAHETEEKEGDVVKKRPDVSGSARKDIVKELDFMGYMEMSGNKRTISFSPSSAYYAKNSLGLDAVIEIPEIQIRNNFIKDVVVAAIRNRREQDRAQAGPYEELVRQIDAIVSAAKDPAALNDAYEKLAALKQIWDSKFYAWSKITEAAKALNATWNRAEKRFAGPAAPRPEAPREAEERPEASPDEVPKPPEKTMAEYNALKIELKKIMSSVDSQDAPLFSDEEYAAVDKTLSGMKGSSIEDRVQAIARLLDDKKLALQARLSSVPDKPAASRPPAAAATETPPAATAPPAAPGSAVRQLREKVAEKNGQAAAPAAPPLKEEQAERADDFEDDLPFTRGKAVPAQLEIF